MPTFEIPDGPTTIEAKRSSDPKNPQPALTSAVYSVTNKSGEGVDGRLGVVASGPSKAEWFAIDGDRERNFGSGETQTATVKVTFPPDAAAGDYPFRLRVVAINDPDNDHAEGPMTSARLGPGVGTTKSLLWLWILLGVVAVLIIGGGLYFALRESPEAPVAKAPDTGLDSAATLQLAEKKTAEWIDGYNARDAKALVALSEPPFTMGDTLLLTEAQIRDAYTAMIGEAGSAKISVVDISSAPLSKLTEDPLSDQQLQRLKLKRDDVAVDVRPQGDRLRFIFRRSRDDVRLASVVGQIRKPELKMDLTGKWTDGSPQSAVIYSQNGSFVIDMSEFSRGPAHGSFVGPTTITVTFAEGASFTGELSPRQASPTRIIWSNGSSWFRRP